MSPDPPAKLDEMAAKVKDRTGGAFGVTLAADANHAVIDRYGLLNETAAAKGRYLPHPTTYVIDEKGVVRWKFTERDYKVRPSNEMIVEQLKRLGN